MSSNRAKTMPELSQPEPPTTSFNTSATTNNNRGTIRDLFVRSFSNIHRSFGGFVHPIASFLYPTTSSSTSSETPLDTFNSSSGGTVDNAGHTICLRNESDKIPPPPDPDQEVFLEALEISDDENGEEFGEFTDATDDTDELGTHDDPELREIKELRALLRTTYLDILDRENNRKVTHTPDDVTVTMPSQPSVATAKKEPEKRGLVKSFFVTLATIVASAVTAVPPAANALVARANAKPEDIGPTWWNSMDDTTKGVSIADGSSSWLINAVVNFLVLPIAMQKFFVGTKKIFQEPIGFIVANIGGVSAAFVALALGLSGFAALGVGAATAFAIFNSVIGWATRFVALKDIFLRISLAFNKDVRTQDEALSKLAHLKEEYLAELNKILQDGKDDKDGIVYEAIKEKLKEEIRQFAKKHKHTELSDYTTRLYDVIDSQEITIENILENIATYTNKLTYVEKETTTKLNNHLKACNEDYNKRKNEIFLEAVFGRLIEKLSDIAQAHPDAIKAKTTREYAQQYGALIFDITFTLLMFLPTLPIFGQTVYKGIRFFNKATVEALAIQVKWVIGTLGVFSSAFYGLSAFDARRSYWEMIQDNLRHRDKIKYTIAKVVGLSVANWFASNSFKNVAYNVANDPTNIYSIPSPNESTAANVLVVFNQFSALNVNVLNTFRKALPITPPDVEDPSLEDIRRYWQNTKEHPIPREVARAMRKLSLFSPNYSSVKLHSTSSALSASTGYLP